MSLGHCYRWVPHSPMRGPVSIQIWRYVHRRDAQKLMSTARASLFIEWFPKRSEDSFLAHIGAHPATMLRLAPGNGDETSMEIVYVFTNLSFPDWVKIGRCKDLKARLKSLSQNTATPLPFRCFYACKVADAKKVEKQLHSVFAQYRVYRLHHLQV